MFRPKHIVGSIPASLANFQGVVMKDMTTKQKRVKEIIEKFKNYLDKYTEEDYYLYKKDEVIMDDMLYGLGLAFDSKEYSCAGGYERFKAVLEEHIG